MTIAADYIKDTKRRKQVQLKAEDQGDRVIRFTASDASEDRDGDILMPAGADLSHYLKNPVVLWAHDYSKPPIGKAVGARVEGGAVIIDVKFLDPNDFDPNDAHAKFADHIYRLYRQGVLNAGSVGFLPKNWEMRDSGGWMFTEWELMEFSMVPVQSNRNALAQRQFADAREAIEEWATKALETTGWEFEEQHAELEPFDMKAGRVLSKRNYGKLKNAHQSIGEVLESATDPDADDDEKSTKVGQLAMKLDVDTSDASTQIKALVAELKTVTAQLSDLKSVKAEDEADSTHSTDSSASEVDETPEDDAEVSASSASSDGDTEPVNETTDEEKDAGLSRSVRICFAG